MLARAAVPFSFLVYLSVLHFLWVGLASFRSILMLLAFLSALTFTGPEKYLILILVNYDLKT